MKKQQNLINLIEIFILRCEVINLHCYETDCREDEVSYRCDYNKESTFEITKYYDEETEETDYLYIDFHDTDSQSNYKKCDIDIAIKIVKEECNKQGVFV